ncbi:MULTISPECIES: MarR family winged helix-turn-helix transcriptional regulator [Streptomyces]|uniref:DNA-binding transcriptional regulator, MarR family n=1 Tax=Streptomyces misionensis TaxID=67331 RepID=A0A1H5GUM1_9ACTN|nr:MULTISPECIES: MarR family winged helix-turn-helix transcriptional regulator [Streptomyces]SEE19360.1 DNA-binding transcriptional regulator, MarR family [Streptomyces misionensis]SFY48227.1 putative HTH-type transcriptional regulator [Streptomyces sp. F-1]
MQQTAQLLAETAAAVIRVVTDHRDLSLTAASTLARLEREGPLRLTLLAAAEGVAQPSMTQLVQRLERQGLIMRVGDAVDGRVTLIGISDAGRDVLAARRRSRDARLADLMAALPDDDQRALTEAMQVVAPLVQRMLTDDAPSVLQPERRHTGSNR